MLFPVRATRKRRQYSDMGVSGAFTSADVFRALWHADHSQRPGFLI